jgi:hypothetical protein
MQVIPCALADITRSAAALNALRLVVEQARVPTASVHVTVLTESLLKHLPEEIFESIQTTRTELKKILKTFKKPYARDFKTRKELAKAKRQFTNAQHLVWKLVFDFDAFPFNTGRTFQSKIKTDGEKCSVFFLNEVF